MLDRRELLNRLIEGVGVREEESVSVRETYWGYIIHSTKPGSERAMRDMFFRLIMASSWIAVIGIWIAPAQMFPASPLFLKLALSVLLLGISYAALALCRPPAGYEFQVDANKREIRTAILNSKGERRGITKASFDEVSDPVMKRKRDGQGRPSLALRIKAHGQETLLPVAIGEEKTLMAVYDRLMRDLRPMEERVVGLNLHTVSRPMRRGQVFPPLGPEEIAA